MLKNISEYSNLSIIDIKQLKIINYSAFTTCNIMKGSGTHLHSSIGNGGKGRHTLEDAPDETKWFDEPKTLADAITWYQVPGTPGYPWYQDNRSYKTVSIRMTYVFQRISVSIR